MSFGEKLQKLRKAQGLSQEELAARLSVPRQTISKARLTPFIVRLCVGILCLAMIWAPFLSAGDYEVVDTSGKVLYTGFMAYLKAKKAEAVFFLCAGAAAVGLIGLIASAFKESDPKE